MENSKSSCSFVMQVTQQRETRRVSRKITKLNLLWIVLFFWKLAGNFFQLQIISPYKKCVKITYFQEKFPTGFTASISLEKISFSLLRPYLQKPYANLSETNVVSPQTRLMCVLIAGLRRFSLLSDLLVKRMDLNLRAGVADESCFALWSALFNKTCHIPMCFLFIPFISKVLQNNVRYSYDVVSSNYHFLFTIIDWF